MPQDLRLHSAEARYRLSKLEQANVADRFEQPDPPLFEIHTAMQRAASRVCESLIDRREGACNVDLQRHKSTP